MQVRLAVGETRGGPSAGPLLRELLSFADSSALVEKLEEAVPGIKKVVELRKPEPTK